MTKKKVLDECYDQRFVLSTKLTLGSFMFEKFSLNNNSDNDEKNRYEPQKEW